MLDRYPVLRRNRDLIFTLVMFILAAILAAHGEPPQKPSFVPPDIPAYPNRTTPVVTTVTIVNGGVPVTRMAFETMDSPEAVFAWYRQALAATIWHEVTIMATTPELGYEDNRGCPRYQLIILAPAGPPTQVILLFYTLQCRDQYVPTFTPTQP